MLQEKADGILQHPGVLSVTFFSLEGKMLMSRSRPGETAKEEWNAISNSIRELTPQLESERKPLLFDKTDRMEFLTPVFISLDNNSTESLYFSDSVPEQKTRIAGFTRVVLDKRELNVRLHELLVTGLVMGITFLGVALITAFLVARKVTMPLLRLMGGVKALEQGDLTTRLIVDTEDELGEVSRAFNSMAKTLQQREAENRELGEQLRNAQKMEAKEEWERTFDSVPDLIAILDAEHCIVRINHAMADRLNITKESAIGTRAYEQLHWADTSSNTALLSALIDSSAGYSGELYQEKMQHYFLVTISPMHKPDGSLNGSVYVARDVTKRKLADDLLRKSEERFRLIADTIVEAFWLADISTNKMLYVSPGYERIWGRPPDDLYESSLSFFDSIHPEDRNRVAGNLAMKSTGQPFEHEYRIIRPDGSVRWVWDRGYPVAEGGEWADCYTGVALDITEQKHAAEERNSIQAKLIQANKMTSLGLMVSGLAHEVNNPNSSIKLAAHLLAKSWQDMVPILEQQYRQEGNFRIAGQPFSQAKSTLPEHIAGIRSNSLRIEGIIKNLRDFVAKGTANLSSQADINAIVSVASTLLNTEIKLYTRRFRLKLHENLPPVQGNPQQLEQVVINLIMNAVQSVPDRDRKVIVATGFDPATGLVMISVEDEGTGIPPEIRDRIGEPFFSTKLHRGGTGLGLAISNSIISEHKGVLEIESEPGQGTAVRVKLPAVMHDQGGFYVNTK